MVQDIERRQSNNPTPPPQKDKPGVHLRQAVPVSYKTHTVFLTIKAGKNMFGVWGMTKQLLSFREIDIS